MDVTSSNFKYLYPTIHNELIDCDFVGFDLEYTAIELQNQSKYSLFDSLETRYEKLRKCLTVTSPLQFGLALFKRECDNDGFHVTFSSKVYNFLLLPPSFDIFDGQFVCSSSALKFLRMNNIDLNNIVDNGISFVNDEQSNSLHSFLKDPKNQPFAKFEGNFTKALNDCHDKIFAWLNDENGSDSLDLINLPHVHPYQLQFELRKRFEDIWTKDSGRGNITVFKVDVATRCHKVLAENNFDKKSDKYSFYQEIIGFTRLMKAIINFKKPIVGHNIFLDLVAMYEKFCGSLPHKFSEFQEDIHRLFPTIYDTKYLFYQLRKQFPCLDNSSASGLEDIFEQLMKLNNDRDIGRISVSMENNSDGAVLQAHHAGYDAYMAGASLLLLGQLVYMTDRNIGEFSVPDKKREIGVGPVTIPAFCVYKELLSPYCNVVNLIRARNDCVSFDIRKNSSKIIFLSRPPYLLIYKRLNLGHADNPDTDNYDDQDLSLQKIPDLLGEHGQGDSRLFKSDGGRDVYIVAMSSFSGARSLLKAFRNHPTICVRKYSAFSDNPVIQQSILCAAVVSTLVSSIAVGSMLIPSK